MTSQFQFKTRPLPSKFKFAVDRGVLGVPEHPGIWRVQTQDRKSSELKLAYKALGILQGNKNSTFLS